VIIGVLTRENHVNLGRFDESKAFRELKGGLGFVPKARGGHQVKDSKGRRRLLPACSQQGANLVKETINERGVKLQLTGCSWAALIMAIPLMIG